MLCISDALHIKVKTLDVEAWLQSLPESGSFGNEKVYTTLAVSGSQSAGSNS